MGCKGANGLEEYWKNRVLNYGHKLNDIQLKLSQKATELNLVFFFFFFFFFPGFIKTIF